MADGKSTWIFPRTFWFANLIELFERAAYYGCFLFLTVYLTKRVGFTDVETGYITGIFSFLLYFLPTIVGAVADRTGYKKAFIFAFTCLAVGYTLLGAYPSKITSLISLTIILVGGAIVKPVMTGTVAKCSDDVNRARAYSIFYWAVNIGAFAGKAVIDPIRLTFENPAIPGSGLQYINFYAACMALIALLFTIFAYKNVDSDPDPRSIKDILRGFARVMMNGRFLCLIIITGFFWFLQVQLYATMPKYILRTVGEFAKPGWIANVNPLTVILLVIPITYMVRKLTPMTSIAISFLIIPFSVLPVAMAPMFGRGEISLGWVSVNTIVLMMVIGIVFQGLAECFLSPKYYEFASKQAPKGETALYMGYCKLNSAFGWLFGFILSGILLDKYCPDPSSLPEGLSELERASYYSHSHYIWYVFTAIGVLGFVLLLVFKIITDRIDKKKSETASF